MLPARDATPDEIAQTGLIHRVYIPAETAASEPGHAAPRPLTVLVHGRCGNASVMWFFAKSFASRGSVIVSPQAPKADVDGGFSWWKYSALSGRPDERPLDERFRDARDTAELLHGFIRRCLEVYSCTAQGLTGAGFSQGGAVLSTLALVQPALFHGVAMLSSFIPRSVMDSENQYPREARSKFFLAHGTKDETIPFPRAEETVAWLRRRGTEVEFAQEDVAHKVGSQSLKALGRWVEALPRY